MALFLTASKIGEWGWQIGKIRLKLLVLLAGHNRVAINLNLNHPDGGWIGGPVERQALYTHNVFIWHDGHLYDFETEVMASEGRII